MSSTPETLFSLELVIDYVRLDCRRGNVLDPVTVGLRFLDFPTLLISRKEDILSHSAFADLPAEASSYADERDKYFFHKGKSCLFKMNLDALHNHLSNTPLYAMVLDMKDEVPKLIGSSMVSLAKVTERIKMDVDKHGIGTPSSCGEKIVTPLCNLMGNNIGTVSLAYKIVSLGANLIPHIPCDRVFQVSMTHTIEQQGSKAHIECARVLNIDTDETEKHHADVLSPVSPDGQPADVVKSEAKQPGIAAVTQTEPTKQKVSWSVSDGNDAQENTTFCPPPLFYSSSVKNQQERFAEKCGMLNVELESLNIEDPAEENNEEESADMHDVPEITAAMQQQRMADPAPPGDVLRQLPLLNALLIELSQLTSQTQHQQPVSIHPNLAWLYTSATEAHNASDAGENPKSETFQHESPKRRPGQSKIKGCIIPPMSPSGKTGSSAKKCLEKLQSKKKLKYGLTHTFRLRLQHAKTAGTKRHCLVYQDVPQVMPQRQTLPENKHAGKSVSKRVNLDETVETLRSIVDMDNAPIQITSSKPQMRFSAYESCTKNVTSMTKDKILVTEPERKIRVRSVLRHYSDRSDQRSASSDRSVHHSSHKTNAAQKYSECGRAESRGNRSSSEQEYQDDFTSVDATDGFSPEPLSSPEPYRRQRNSGSTEHSDSDGGSYKSKVLPVPVKAETSPHRSLKSTHVIRPRPQTSALSLSSDNSEDGSPTASSSQQRKTPSVRRTFGRSESFDTDPADGDMTLSRLSVPNKSVSSLDQSAEERDELGSLGLDKNYQHVSELVINKLPGYTL
ncbi:microtubule-associated protein 10 [Triplophysa rosa]|uniref:Microtubule-associated protein 10 n=1 Tax=Triplophysa rosa TaxID=992332 RepID=A0A9W7WN18_TRIRA|nr:microtubule-associated protein 10 [Triplophysa rosa]KAI7805189.1 putative microtubule-associated protein 10 [Triplophysa rosa]